MIVVRCTDADREALAGIAINPLDLAEDGTDYLNIRIVTPWGHEKQQYRDDKLAVWFLYINAHQKTSLHCHPSKSSVLMIVGGRGILETLDKVWQLSEGDVIAVEPGAFHRTIALENGLVLWEMESPPHKRDLVRLEDKYGRGQGYERVQPPGEISAA